MRPTAFALSVSILLASVAIGRDEPHTQQQPVGGLAFADEIEVTVVNISAYVADKKGDPVADLTLDDFQIWQDGEFKPISNFEVYTRSSYEEYSARSTARTQEESDPEVAASPPQQPRPVYVVLFIDNQNLHPIDRNRVLSRVRGFVRDNLFPPVQMMVVSYQRSLKIEQEFTSDRQLIFDALKEQRMKSGGRADRDLTRADLLQQIDRLAEQQKTAASQGKPRGFSYSTVYQQVVSFAEEELNDLAYTADALREVISSISGLDGKKSVVYVSNGLPMVPGLEVFTAFTDAIQSGGMPTEISRFDRTSIFESLAAAANAQDISLITVGAAGMAASRMATAQYAGAINTLAANVGANNYLDSLRFMAENTGGIAIVDTNNFEGGFEKIGNDLFTYYSIGYNLNMSGRDKVHRIKIELPNHPEYTVRYRRRFVEKSLESRVRDRVLTGLMFDLDHNPMQMRCTHRSPAPANEGRWTLPVRVVFPLRNVALLPEGDDYVNRLVVFIAARDSDGKQSELVRHESEVRISAENYDLVQDANYSFDASLLMEAGRYRIIIGLLDPITRQASYLITKTTISE
jgi:VWFA-related protein